MNRASLFNRVGRAYLIESMRFAMLLFVIATISGTASFTRTWLSIAATLPLFRWLSRIEAARQ
jgi:hypothetical protein